MAPSSPHLGIALRRGPVEELIGQARSAKAAGLDALWIADHITGFPVDAPVFEPFTALAALGHEAPGLQLGVAVTDVFRRNPAVLAQAAMTVQAMTGAPLILGIGTGEAMNLAPYGISHARPTARLKDTIVALKALGRSSMENPVDQEGEGVLLRQAYLQRPGDLPAPPIFIGTNGPRGRALVGEVADGWLPIMLSPELIREDLAGIRASAEAAGRDPSAIRVAYHAQFAVADDTESAFRMIAGNAKSILLGFPALAERLGSSIPTDFAWNALEVTGGVEEKIRQSADQVPDEIVRTVTIYGTPQDCAEKINAFAEAGVTDLVLRTVNPLDELTDALDSVVRAVGA